MKIQKYVIEQYTGMRPLRAPGSSQISPSFLGRLSFSRPEGYEPVHRSALSGSNSLIEPVDDYVGLLGASPDGLWVAELNASRAYRLARGTALVKDHTLLGSPFLITFIRGFGAYSTLEAILGVDENDNAIYLDSTNDVTLTKQTTEPVLPRSDGNFYEMGVMEYIWLAVEYTRIGKIVLYIGYNYDELDVTFDVNDELNSMVLTTFPAYKAPTSAPAGAPDVRWEVYMRRATVYEDRDVSATEAEDGIKGAWFISENRWNELLANARTRMGSQEFRLTGVMDPGDTDFVPYPVEVGRVLPDHGKIILPGSGGHAEYHNGRVWMTTPNSELGHHTLSSGLPAYPYDIPSEFSSPLAIVFSEIGYVNLMGISSYIILPSRSSTKVTGMISVSDVLYVFGENNTYMITGDPATDDLEVEDHPQLIGCDEGKSPAALGHTIYTVWRNRIYEISPEESREVSYGVLDRESNVRDIAVDVDTNTLAVMLPEGVLHYDPLRNTWYSNEVTPNGVDWSNEARFAPSVDGLLFYVEGGSIFTSGRVFGYDTGEDDADMETIIDLRSIDAGNALRADYWRAVRVPFGPSETFTGLDVDGDGQSFPDAPPDAKLYYNVEGGSVDVASNPSTQEITGRREGNELVFRFPWGLLGRRIDVRIKIQMGQRTVIQPGITFEFSPGPDSSAVGEAS